MKIDIHLQGPLLDEWGNANREPDARLILETGDRTKLGPVIEEFFESSTLGKLPSVLALEETKQKLAEAIADSATSDRMRKNTQSDLARAEKQTVEERYNGQREKQKVLDRLRRTQDALIALLESKCKISPAAKAHLNEALEISEHPDYLAQAIKGLKVTEPPVKKHKEE